MELLKKAFDLAFAEAEIALEEGEIPVGAVVFSKDEIISFAHNEREKTKNPTAHAEVLAIERAAEKLNDWRLNDLSMAVTLEPCVMCAGAIKNSRIKNIYFAAFDEDAGALGSKMNVLDENYFICGGLEKERAEKLIQDFFKAKRKGEE